MSANQPDALPTRSQVKRQFSNTLRELLLAKNWSQSDLGREADIGRDSISKYIAGKTLPGPKQLAKLANALNINVRDLRPDGYMAEPEEDPAPLSFRALPGTGMAQINICAVLPMKTAKQIMDLVCEHQVS